MARTIQLADDLILYQYGALKLLVLKGYRHKPDCYPVTLVLAECPPFEPLVKAFVDKPEYSSKPIRYIQQILGECEKGELHQENVFAQADLLKYLKTAEKKFLAHLVKLLKVTDQIDKNPGYGMEGERVKALNQIQKSDNELIRKGVLRITTVLDKHFHDWGRNPE